MKLQFLLVLSFFSAFTGLAHAQYFTAQAQVSVLPGQVSVQVYNPYYEPIVCSGQVFGQVAYGPVFNAYFVEQYMTAGTHRYAYVYTTPYAPFVSGWANINCRFARY